MLSLSSQGYNIDAAQVKSATASENSDAKTHLVPCGSSLLRTPKEDTFQNNSGQKGNVKGNLEPSKKYADILKGVLEGVIGTLAVGSSLMLIFKGASKLNTSIFALSTFKNSKIFKTSEAFLGLDNKTKRLINSNHKIRAFYSSLDGETLGRLTSAEIMQDLADERFLKGLSLDFGKISPKSEESRALAFIISRRNAYLQKTAVSQFESATSVGGVKYFNRAKGTGSTLDKLDSKLSKKTISSFNDANALIADGIGTRVIFESLDAKKALKALKEGGITDGDLKILKTIWKCSDYGSLSAAEFSLLKRANSILSEAQTQNFVDRLALAIKNNEISMSEINNYAGDGGIPYFTERQIKQLRDAFLQSNDASNKKKFKIVTRLTKDSELALDLGFSEDYINKISQKSSKTSGYTASQANFRYKNGAFGEGQFRGVEVQEFAEYEHFPYDIKKGKHTVEQKIEELIALGKKDVAKELSEYQDLVRTISKDKALYAKYNDYLREIYNYLRKKELGIFEILGIKNPTEPVLSLPGLSLHQNELLSKKCLECLAKQQVYSFIHPK